MALTHSRGRGTRPQPQVRPRGRRTPAAGRSASSASRSSSGSSTRSLLPNLGGRTADVLPRVDAARLGQRGAGLGHLRHRPQHRRRLRRSARPRLRRLLGHRRLHRRLVHVDASSTRSSNGIYFLSAAPPSQPGIHLNFWLVLVRSPGCICACAGIIIGAPTLRLKSDYLALVTLGFGEIIPQIFLNGENIARLQPVQRRQGHRPARQHLDRAVRPGDIAIGRPRSRSPSRSARSTSRRSSSSSCSSPRSACSSRCASARAGSAAPGWRSARTSWPRRMMGVPLMRTKLAAYAVGAFMGGLGGVVYAVHNNSVFPDRFNFAISIILLAMVVLGGMGNVWGVIVGALGAGLVQLHRPAAVRQLVQRRSSAPTSTSRRTTTCCSARSSCS